MTLGFNNFGFGMGNIYGAPTVDQQALNRATTGFSNQINGFSTSPVTGFAGFAGFNNLAQNGAWFNQAANAFSFNGAAAGDSFTFSTAGPSTGATPAGSTTTTTTTTTTGTTTTGATGTTPAGTTSVANPDSEAQKQANEICRELFVAMKGAGTDEKAVDAALAKITKDNVLEVMETYVNLYSDQMDGETLIESLQNEYYYGWFSNKLKNITGTLTDKLAERAKDMGLDAEGQACKAKVTAENNRWWNTRDEEVALSVNTLFASMVVKRG